MSGPWSGIWPGLEEDELTNTRGVNLVSATGKTTMQAILAFIEFENGLKNTWQALECHYNTCIYERYHVYPVSLFLLFRPALPQPSLKVIRKTIGYPFLKGLPKSGKVYPLPGEGESPGGFVVLEE